MAHDKMMHGNILIVLGFLLIIDSFVGIQGMFGLVQINAFNGFEFIVGLIVGFFGYKAREMK